MKITKRQLKSVIREVIEESYSDQEFVELVRDAQDDAEYDDDAFTTWAHEVEPWSDRTHLNDTWSNSDGAIAHVETKYDKQSGKVGRDLFAPDEFNRKTLRESIGKIPKGDLMIMKNRLDDTITMVIIDIASERISFPEHYDFDDDRYGELKWERPYKYSKLFIDSKNANKFNSYK